jgi:hypothetical protein
MKSFALSAGLSLAGVALLWATIGGDSRRAAPLSEPAHTLGIAGASPTSKVAPRTDLVLFDSSDLARGDEIRVTRFIGSRGGDLRRGEVYTVRGRYLLQSVVHGRLELRSMRDEEDLKEEGEQEREAFGRVDVKGSGEFEFEFRPTRSIYGVDVEFVSDDGARLGGIPLLNRGC